MPGDERLRVLVLGGKVTEAYPIADVLGNLFEVDLYTGMHEALAALRERDYHAVFADVGDFLPLERGLVDQRSTLVLNTIGEGVCIVDASGACAWSNHQMRSFSPRVIEKVKQICLQALSIFSRQIASGADVNQHRSRKFPLEVGDGRYFELMASPVVDEQGEVHQVVAVVWDATRGRRLQRKIDAIDAAGGELSKLQSDAIAKLSPQKRLQLVQDKVIRFSRDLMQFDHFVIRLLDKRTNKLELVIAEGLPIEAMQIDLYAQPEGNGISGYVAATGRSYICHDTEKDPRYVLGIEHSKSTLTVPLRLHDEVVGVFNIESTRVGGFNEDDRQFAEIFGRYIAMALNILDLMVVERYTTTGRLADNVVQEMAGPLNDIVTEAQMLMEEYIGDDTMRGRLQRIAEHVETIRETLRDVVAGPKAVLGVDKEVAKRVDPLLAGKRVLIADDESNIRQTIGDILAKRGCQCTVCQDGYEAINLIEQDEFDLIISDIKMPHRNGYEIYAAAHRQQPGLPVILMTGFGYDPNHSIVRASQEGLSSVLFKPFQVEQLLDLIHKVLGSDAGPADESAAVANPPQASAPPQAPGS